MRCAIFSNGLNPQLHLMAVLWSPAMHSRSGSAKPPLPRAVIRTCFIGPNWLFVASFEAPMHCYAGFQHQWCSLKSQQRVLILVSSQQAAMRHSSVVLVALATATSLQLATAQQALSGWMDGIATNYGTSAVKTCCKA